MELFGHIIKYMALGLIIIPLVLIRQNVLWKEDKQLSVVTVIIIYVLMVALFVLNEYYGFMYN